MKPPVTDPLKEPSEPNIEDAPHGDPLEDLLRGYVDRFIANNRAAKAIANDLRVIGIGLKPLVDYLGFFSHRITDRAKEFKALGYVHRGKTWSVKDRDWRAKVYCRAGYPSVIIYEGGPGKSRRSSEVEQWFRQFGGETPHHLAVKVDNLENGIFYLEKQGIAFTGKSVGSKDAKLRQVFARPDFKEGRPYTVLELTERHGGYRGFIPDHMVSLMKTFWTAK